VLLYAVYAAAGLQQLFFSLFDAEWKITFHLVPFKAAVCCLAGANALHAAHVFGLRATATAVFGAFLLIVYFEELGLTTGLVFGEYHFTAEMGWFVSPNLPALVPVLWGAVLYPSLLLGAAAAERLCPGRARPAATVALSAAVLTGFDVVCEPVSTVFGHQVL
ncbi:unnamed protein product, partial [Ectocarpus fasciculatus]